MRKSFIMSLLLMVVGGASADSIYLCKAHTGGMFWAHAHCSQHNAAIDRIVNVPDNLPWDQKVALGEQALRGGQQAGAATSQSDPNAAKQAECTALSNRVTQLDSEARQPQSAATQDWLRSERRIARDRQFQLRC